MTTIRSWFPEELSAVAELITRAFAPVALSNHNEAEIVAGLERAAVLTLSLVAEMDDTVVGHIAFSPVQLHLGGGKEVTGWYGLGPLAVEPERQKCGIGSALVDRGLAELQALGAAGCVVLGEPAFYRRFGFAAGAGPQLAGVPPEFFLCRSFGAPPPVGVVTYHPAFFAAR